MNRKTSEERQTNETNIKLDLNIDGSGKAKISTGIGFFDHMLTVFVRHSKMDLTLVCKGDLAVDGHHSIEDCGICLGQAFKQALGDMKGIKRFANVSLPMDEALCDAAVDVSGRGLLVYNVPDEGQVLNGYDCEMTEEFFRAFAHNAGITLHINLRYGKNAHHVAEAVYKSVGVALRRATEIDPRETGVPSSKGVL